eukprot:590674-Karenia_brevis.AAC.1
MEQPNKRKQDYITPGTLAKIKQRGILRHDNKYTDEEYNALNKDIKKSLKVDKKSYTLNTVKQELDVRDRWAGIRALKKEYHPNPYNRKDENGRIVAQKDKAETAAKYLAEKQWGNRSNNDEQTYPRQKI